jgi:hypothetical protein
MIRKIATKECSKCHIVKPYEDFYMDKSKKDKVKSECKKCCKEHDHRKHEKYADRINAGRRDYYEKHREERMKKSREYSNKRYRKNVTEGTPYKPDPFKEKARIIFHNAINSGVITRKTKCEVSKNCRGAIHAHHPDYSKPLDVRWLCKKHHMEHHRRPLLLEVN